MSDKDIQLFVGSDSHLLNGKWVFATVIAAYRPGKGGRFFYLRDYANVNEFKHLQQRLTEEALRSLNVANEIKEMFGRDPEVHLDLSKSTHKSSRYTKELTAMVNAYGFKCQVKPDSWVSSTLADKSAR
jgi:predicted RNase H-related nuclease YkuK (DUF458 family)